MERQYHQMWRAIGICDIICGTNVLHDQRQKFSKLQYFCRIGSFIIYFTFMFVLIYNSYKFRKNLLLFILASSMFVSFFTAGMDVHSLVRRRDNFIKVINWCRNVIEADGPIFAKTRKTCIRLVKVIFATTYYLGFSATLLPAVMGLISAPGEPVAPMPFILPLLDPKTWIAFILNTSLQTLSCFVWDTLAGIVYSILGIHYYATIAYVDDLKEKIEALGREIVEKQRQKKFMIRKTLRVMAFSNGSSRKENAATSTLDEDKYFDEGIKEVAERYSNAVQ